MKLVLILIGVASLLATVALARLSVATHPLVCTEPPTFTDPAPIVDMTGLGFFSRKTMTYYLVHGEWDEESLDRSASRLTPRGTGQHCVEMGWTVAYSTVPLVVNVPAEGEFFILQDAIVIDFSGRGAIQLERISTLDLPPFCDSDKSLVISCVMTGGCWEKPFITDPDTGEYTRKCNKHPGSACEATTTQNTTPPTVATTNWGCSTSDDRTIHYQPANGIWEARSAVTCGAVRPTSTPGR